MWHVYLVIIALLNCHELAYLRLQDAEPTELPISIDEYTTLSPIRSSLSTQGSFISTNFEINNDNNTTTTKENMSNRHFYYFQSVIILNGIFYVQEKNEIYHHHHQYQIDFFIHH